MDFRDTPEEAAYRVTLRKWLAANTPSDWTAITEPDDVAQ